MFTGIPIPLLAATLLPGVFRVYGRLLRSFTQMIWFIRTAHELQEEISMNAASEQGENVISIPNGQPKPDLTIRERRQEQGRDSLTT
jgi:hypothetical protein